MSWLDAFALAMGCGLVAANIWRERRASVDWAVVFAIAGFAAGMVPAALTWEGLPHSLRSLGSWPFVALLVGCIMAKWERAWAPSLAACSIVALSFALLFWCDYFTRYPKRAGPWFAANVKEAAVNAESSGDWQGFVRNLYRYDSRAVRYYLIRYGRQGCDASARFYRESAPSRR